MRRRFVETVESLMAGDERVVVLLGDIGVHSFRQAFARHPGRIHNLGICEQSMIGVAAGMAKEGFIPIVHSIAPFVVERCYEQLKVDFAYQALGGNIVSVGASYDYAMLGATHHCPADVAVLRAIPGVEVVVPGTPQEFEALFRASYDDGHLTYFRLSECSHDRTANVRWGKATRMQQGAAATVLSVGPTLGAVMAAVAGLDVEVLYYTTLAPFDSEALRSGAASRKVVVVEPFYRGSLAADVCESFPGQGIDTTWLGVPREFVRQYGSREDHDRLSGLTPEAIRSAVLEMIHA